MLTVHNTEAIRRIEAAIGYTFHDKRLLVQVLTRKTYLKIDPEAPDNEVLEFYGDTLMNYHVTNYFMAKYAHMLDDGLFFMRTVEQFTDLRSHYVCNRYLTERVKALGLARHLRAQNRDSELRRDGEKAYADIFESLVGAIYLDSYQDDNLIRAFILRQLGIEPRRAPAEIESYDYDSLRQAPPLFSEEPEDTSSEAVALDLPIAEPEPETSTPSVAPTEEASEVTEVIPESRPEAVASSETDPALEDTAEVEPSPLTMVAPPSPKTQEPPRPSSKQEELAALCEAKGIEAPTYGETPPNAPNARPVAACTLKYKDTNGKLIKISLNDSGRTLPEATEKVAAKMLARVERLTTEAAEKRGRNTGKGEPSRKALPRPVPASSSLEELDPRELPAYEETPAEALPPAVTETPVETLPEASEETPVEALPPAVTDAPVETLPEASEATPAEALLPAVTETPVETLPEASEATPVEALPPAVTETPVETLPEASEETPVEALLPAVTETPVETPAEVLPQAGPETVSDTPKPTKKAPARRRSPSGQKATAKSQAVAQGVTSAEQATAEKTPSEDTPKATPTKENPPKKGGSTRKKQEDTGSTPIEDKPTKPKRSSSRKPKSSKAASSEEKPDEVSREDQKD